MCYQFFLQLVILNKYFDFHTGKLNGRHLIKEYMHVLRDRWMTIFNKPCPVSEKEETHCRLQNKQLLF